MIRVIFVNYPRLLNIYCTNKDNVKPLWGVIEKIIRTRISFKQTLRLGNLLREDSVLTIICLLIYEEWIIFSLEN